jgi:predicted small lipoprotein YifL
MKLVLLAAVILLAGCGYDGSIRYPCQEVENWKEQMCQSPYCDVTGTCPRDLLPDLFDKETHGKEE